MYVMHGVTLCTVVIKITCPLYSVARDAQKNWSEDGDLERFQERSRSVLHIAKCSNCTLYRHSLHPSFSKEQLVPVPESYYFISSKRFALISGFRSINFQLDSAGPSVPSRQLRSERGDK